MGVYKMSAYRDCKFCGGRGCIACPGERERNAPKFGVPIFTAKLDDPHDMELLKRVIGKDAVEKAFSPGGGGVDAIEREAAIASFLQAVRVIKTDGEKADEDK